jgi:hypothetical protein
MQSRKVHIPTASTSPCKVLKPPGDLWELLDAARMEIHVDYIPNNAFSLREFCDRYGVSDSTGRRQIQRLVRNGRVEVVGPFGPQNTKYYRMVVK